MGSKELEIYVSGRVQGVSFRGIVEKIAKNLGLKGFVRNLDDGRVKIVVQGTDKRLKEFLSEIHSKQGFANINEMSYKIIPADVKYEEFFISRSGHYIIDRAKGILNLGKRVMSKDVGEVPRHVAIIPDGNRRWAREKNLEETRGHYKSGNYDRMKELVEEAKDLGVEYLSFWAFSSENWKRDKREVKAVFSVIERGVDKFLKDAKENKVRFRHVGRKDRLPKELLGKLEMLEEATKDFEKLNVQLFLDYGGRDEIVRAVNKILKGKNGEIDEGKFEMYLDTYDIPDPDLIIRTSGEQRMSGFLSYQGAYSEFYFANVHFPDFDKRELKRAVESFGNRERRFGGN